jgi:hypothetical protein
MKKVEQQQIIKEVVYQLFGSVWVLYFLAQFAEPKPTPNN